MKRTADVSARLDYELSPRACLRPSPPQSASPTASVVQGTLSFPGFQYSFCTFFFPPPPLKGVNTQLLPGVPWHPGSIASSNPFSTTRRVTLDTLLDLPSCFSAHEMGGQRGLPCSSPPSMDSKGAEGGARKHKHHSRLLPRLEAEQSRRDGKMAGNLSDRACFQQCRPPRRGGE